MSELSVGAKHELEHDLTPAEAKQTAQDHLDEDPKYYSHLKLMEKSVDAVKADKPSKLPKWKQWKTAAAAKILETRDGVYLQIGQQIQGGSAKAPGADIVAPGLCGPGPVPLCAYQAGWLLAGAGRPKATAIMAGLGAGSGAVGLLYNFDDITLTIAEIDPDVIALAFETFPLLGYYSAEGRLEVVNQDVAACLDKPYDLGFADAYIGSNEHVAGYIPAMASVVTEMWVNVIGTAQSTCVAEVVKLLGQAPLKVQDTPTSNWICTNSQATPDLEFLPFGGLDGEAVADCQLAYDNLLTQLY